MKVSVIIRTYNEEAWVGECIKKIKSQKFKGNLEIIVVDNESKDNTKKIVLKEKVKLITISKKDFSYGRALNFGCEEAKGEFLLFISAHCIPVNEHWVQNLISNFKGNVVGVSGLQTPHPEVTLYQKRRMLSHEGYKKKTYTKPPTIFSNSNSAITKKIWKKYPFDEKVSFREDKLWARDVLNKGYNIVYEPKANVYHYHKFNIFQIFKRGFDVGNAPRVRETKYLILFFLYSFFNETLKDWFFPGKIISKLFWFFMAPIYNFVWLLGLIFGRINYLIKK